VPPRCRGRLLVPETRFEFVEAGLWGVIRCKSRRPLELRDEGEERTVGVMRRACVAE